MLKHGSFITYIALVNIMKYTSLVFVLSALLARKCSGQINRPPEFLKGGDMDKFSLREDTPVGSSVYTLRARDPEGTRVQYYISGDSLTVERDSGVVRLIRPLDREVEGAVEVIVSITDQRVVAGGQPNTISVRREILILDQNDNPPKFLNAPYSFSLDETTPVGSTVYTGIIVTDADIGPNAEMKLSCIPDVNPSACQKFEIRSVAISEGRVRGEVVLKEPLDYEERSSYTMSIAAEDLPEFGSLKSTTNIMIKVNDIQDQPPAFQNAPFTATVLENSAMGTSVLNLAVRDGDGGDPRDLILMIENDENGYFRLGPVSSDDRKVFTTTLETSNPIDRESPDILDNGGLYVLQIKAIEMVNGFPVGDSTIANVTIVVGDANDQPPLFNDRDFEVTISEDIGTNTPLPALNMVVTDMDVGDNAKFSLTLEDVLNSDGMFAVFPAVAIGRTPVIIRVVNATRLDYEDPDRRMFVFKVKAIQDGFPSDSATVTVNLKDANDNAPVFDSDQFILHVPEDVTPGTTIFNLPASDADSGDFGKLTYSLKGFGSDKFEVSGVGVRVSSRLDFEAQRSYSLTAEARDGGGRVTAVNLFVEVTDVNDNAPVFARDVYTRDLLENTSKLLPPLFIKATDSDGPTQGNGRITYSIVDSGLADPGAIAIDPETGELRLTRPLTHAETTGGLVTVTVRATDQGDRPLASTAKLLLKVKKENDGAPEFVNLPYRAEVKENAMGGSSVMRVVANDPDGPDAGISYFLHSGAKDNFVIDQKSGLITVATGADLDRDLYGHDYSITVQAVDSGSPVHQTATATVSVVVEDVNNKPPKFTQESYVEYIPESTNIGEEVLTVVATDPDEDAKLRFSIVEPIVARDKTGSLVTTSAYNYKSAFRIDGITGKITVNQPLEYNSASVIILTVEAVDLNAVDIAFGKQQKASVEVSIYIRAHGEMNPVFSAPWTQAQPVLEIAVPEETLIGSTLLTLAARDPLTHAPVTYFDKISGSDPDNYVSVSHVSGVVALNRRLDFEALPPQKQIRFQVRALIGESKNQRSSEATVLINVQDINDNSPVFSQNSYTTSISESTEYPQSILTVIASDKDSNDGFGTLRYSISGEGSDMFEIDETTGTISIRENATLDREKQAAYNLQVTATDNPTGLANQRRTSIIVVIKVLDENDNAPRFSQEIYTAVIPENVPTDFSIVTVRAADRDAGRNGEVRYFLMQDEGNALGFFSVDSETGVVTVVRPLSGKGRSEPYTVRIQAADQGSPPLQSTCHLLVVVGDTSTNDGVPQFVRPTAGEVAYVHENVSVGTEVFRVVAFDPDNANTADGKVAFKLLDDRNDEFAIDAATGVIATRAPLDRERKENYTMIVVAHDFGFPPQEAHRVLRIVVIDVDDSEPQFQRPLKSQPIEMVMREEEPVGTIVGVVKAVDNDTGINSIIDYYIINGNEEGAFSIRRNQRNEGELVLQRRVDREAVARITLTVRVGKPSEPVPEAPYDFRDLSQTQVSVLVQDIDDNPPTFDQPSYVLGARGNTEVDRELITLHAYDLDASSSPIKYNIRNVTFVRPSTKENAELRDVFHIHGDTGVLSNNEALGQYVEGHFDIVVEAKSSSDATFGAIANVKIYVLQDRDLLKFVFYKRPNEVRELIPQFERDLKLAVAETLSLNVYDTNFYARNDGSLDFESTSSCFQLLENDVIIEPKKVMKILNQAKSPTVRDLYSNYSVVAIESCTSNREAYKMLWSEVAVLVVAAFIAFVSFIICILVCVLYSNYSKKLKRISYFHSVYMIENGGPQPILSPAEQQRIYEWQEMNTPLADAASFRSYPTLR